MKSLAVRFSACIFLSFTLLGCGGSDSDTPNDPFIEPGDFDDLRPYKSDSPYTNVLVDCVAAESVEDACTLATLPLIGMNNETPSIDEVLERLVVSHDWMGVRFEEILRAVPEEMIPIFRAVTAIVIDDDIRPAYYTTRTGAIYLDPAYIWLWIKEAEDINRKEDFRAGFADPLAFRSLGRYVKDNAYAYRWVSLEDASTRTLDDILLIISRLILHELAHANDNFPPGSYAGLNSQLKVAHTAGARSSIGISQQLTTNTPLTSELLYSLAGVMYRGFDPTANDLATTGAEAGAAFELDGATDDYAYSSQYEDVAMLFEVAMMKYFFDVDYDIAYSTAPQGDTRYCEDFPLEWGVRNRIGDAEVTRRAEFVVNQIYPNLDTAAFFNEFPLPQDLNTNQNWCQSVNINSDSNEMRAKPVVPYTVDPGFIDRPYL